MSIKYKKLIGKRLANFNTKAYRDVAFSNGYAYEGQCVTYVRGRFMEKKGLVLPGGPNYAYEYYEMYKNKGQTISYPRSNTACVFNKGRYFGDYAGHIIFIEYVVGDLVYYTESNATSDGKISSDDGILKSISISSLKS